MMPHSLVLLAAALWSIWMWQRVSHEIPRLLFVCSAIFCALFGLAMAPWPIQLAVVVLLINLGRRYPLSRFISEP